MVRQAILLCVVLITTTQAFSWGHVFNNNDKANEINTTPEQVTPTQRHEEPDVDRPLPETLHEEKTFHNARTVSKENVPRFPEDSTLREGMPVSVGQRPEGGELGSLRKEVSKIREPLGPESGGQKVEVMGVPRASEHHVTDGLADAIAGLMRVYNTLMHASGEAGAGMAGGGGLAAGNATLEEGVRAAEGRRGGSSWGAVAVLGGVMAAAVIGLVLMGFGGREREGVLYPPRGPAYV